MPLVSMAILEWETLQCNAPL